MANTLDTLMNNISTTFHNYVAEMTEENYLAYKEAEKAYINAYMESLGMN